MAISRSSDAAAALCDVKWAAFDLNGTLLDPAGIAVALPVPNGEELAIAALDDAVTQAMAETLTGGFPRFADLLATALRRRLGVVGIHNDATINAAVARSSTLPAFPDALPALRHLRDNGLHVAVLTNSARTGAEESIRLAGLDAHIEAVISADEVNAYKPHPRVYAHAVERLKVAPGEVCLMAVHSWDLLGGARAGMHTAWVSRKERRYFSGSLRRPDIAGESLLAVATELAAATAH